MNARRSIHLAGGVLIISLAGCSLFEPLGPDYQSREPQAVRLDSGAAPVFSPQMPPGRWWQLYGNAQLNGYVIEALRENRDLRLAASRLTLVRSARDQATAAMWPSTSVSANYERTRNLLPGMAGFQELNLASASLSLSYEVDLFGRVRRLVESANASVEEQQFAFAATQIRVAADTANAFVSACQAGAALKVAEQLVESSEKTLATVSQLASAGAAGQLDVTRARAQVSSDRATIPPIKAQQKAALYALAVLLGRQPAQYPQEAGRCDVPPTLDKPLPVGNGLALLRRRPDVAEAERGMAASIAAIGVAEASLYPTITLGAMGGGDGMTIPGVLYKASQVWSIGPAMSWTFPNRQAAEAQLRAAGAQADMAVTSYQNTILVALKETETALDRYVRGLEHRQELQHGRDDVRSALDQALLLYRNGAIPYLDVLTAQRNLAEVERQLVDASGQVSANQISVFQALGGGWDDAAQVSADQAMAARVARAGFQRP